MDAKKVIAVAVSLGLLVWINKGYFKKLKAEKSREAMWEQANSPLVYDPNALTTFTGYPGYVRQT